MAGKQLAFLWGSAALPRKASHSPQPHPLKKIQKLSLWLKAFIRLIIRELSLLPIPILTHFHIKK
ncbi:hypothetical protein DYE48_08700 [Halobacillus trueperi]|uniref:Uncharacterized protein n=1 Tax=Halobacillus trueperi TaxID=156205 RepID=A0A3E0J9Q8_9BACI|nr:hypothetical protein DYE48_08700 [Halobacillus trueperi]